MKTKNITFYKNNIKFLVEVTYTSKKILPRCWEANIMLPLGISPISYRNSGWAFGIGIKDKAYVVEENPLHVDATCEINIYDRIVDEVSYQYFCKDKIREYKELVNGLKYEVDKAHAQQLEVLYVNKRKAKKLFKANLITLYEYKKTIKHKDDLLWSISQIKSNIDTIYYVNGRLKKIFRTQ